jgi:archaellum component FlaC
MSTEIDNFVNKIQTISDNVSGAIGTARADIDEEINKITAKIQKITSKYIYN